MRRILTETTFLVLLGLIAVLCYGMIAGMAHSDPNNYERAIQNVLVHEGSGYTNHPSDPGGPTKWGITLRDLREWRNRYTNDTDVMEMEEEEARAIYRARYAKPIRFDELPRGIDYVVLDYAVNAGIGRAMADLSKVLRVPSSQVMTNEMVTAARLLRVGDVIQRLDDRRMAFQMGLPSRFNVFKKGWKNRINSVNRIALAMAGVPMNKAFNDGYFDMIPRIGVGKAYIEEENNGTI